MDQQAQKQAIVAKLTGAPPETLPPPDALDEPWRTIYRKVRQANGFLEAGAQLAKITGRLPGGEGQVRQLMEVLPPDAFGAYPSLEQISGRFTDVRWLWPCWIPRGMVTLFGAAPGAGKSLVALDLARRVIHGEPWPDGAPPEGGGSNVLIVDAEGAPALLDQRARAWDIDRSRLFLMLSPGGGLIDLSDVHQQTRLYEMCRSLEPALVVVDSLAAATARGETSLEAARAILGFLGTIARKGHLALLVIHHLRKAASSRRGTRAANAVRVAAEDLRGSSHLSAAARSVMALSIIGNLPGTAGAGIAPNPDQAGPPAGTPPPAGAGSRFDGPRVLEIVKTNLCRHPPPLGLTFEGQDVTVPTLRYTEYLEPVREPTQTDLCAGWLYHYLHAGGEPVKPADAIRAAGEEGYSRRTVYRARNILGGLVVDLGTGPYDPHKCWALAPGHTQEEMPAAPDRA